MWGVQVMSVRKIGRTMRGVRSPCNECEEDREHSEECCESRYKCEEDRENRKESWETRV